MRWDEVCSSGGAVLVSSLGRSLEMVRRSFPLVALRRSGAEPEVWTRAPLGFRVSRVLPFPFQPDCLRSRRSSETPSCRGERNSAVAMPGLASTQAATARVTFVPLPVPGVAVGMVGEPPSLFPLLH